MKCSVLAKWAQPEWDSVCQYLSVVIILFIAKTKVNVMAENGVRCVICVLRHTHIHTHRAGMRDHKPLSSTCIFSIILPEHRQINCVYWHDSTQTPLFSLRLFQTDIVDSFSLFIRSEPGHVWCLTEMLRKAVIIPFSTQMQKDIDGARRGRATGLLGMLNNTVNHALRAAQQVKVFVCLP